MYAVPVNSFTGETAPVLVSSSNFGRPALLGLLFSPARGGEYLRRGLVTMVLLCSGGVIDTNLRGKKKTC